MSDGVFEPNDLPTEHPAVGTQSSGRWAEIGVGLAAAIALTAIFVAGLWALVVLVEASV